jgi:hypothetical protein
MIHAGLHIENFRLHQHHAAVVQFFLSIDTLIRLFYDSLTVPLFRDTAVSFLIFAVTLRTFQYLLA